MQSDGVERLEQLAAIEKAFKQRAELKWVCHGRGALEALEGEFCYPHQGSSKFNYAVVEVVVVVLVARAVAEAGEERPCGDEKGDDSVEVSNGEGSAEGGDNGREDRPPIRREIRCRDGNHGFGDMDLDGRREGGPGFFPL